jgi:predicted transport protein
MMPASGAGGRRFESDQPHVNIVPLFSPISIDIIKLQSVTDEKIENNLSNPYYMFKFSVRSVVPRKSDIQLFLNLKEGMLNDPRKMGRDISKLGHHANGDYEIKLSDTKDIGYAMSLIRQSYDKN